MQNRGTIWLFSILLAIACLYQLSFSFVTSSFENEAKEFAQNRVDSVFRINPSYTQEQLDSLKDVYSEKYLKDNTSKKVYPILGFTYGECREKQINLGLDLQGGMSVTLEVSVPEMLVALSGNSQDADFNKAINLANSRKAKSQSDYITEFEKAYKEVAPNGKLAAVFHSKDNATKFPRTASNEEIIATLRAEAKVAIDNTEKILRNRIDKFGVVQPTIQKQQYTGRILIDLPGVKDKARVRKVLQSTANLEFWETYENGEIYPLLEQADKALSESLYPGALAAFEAKNKKAGSDTTKAATTDSTAVASADSTKKDTAKVASVDDLLGAGTDSAKKDSKTATADADDRTKVNPLFSVFAPSMYQDKGQFRLGEGAVIGYTAVSDTDRVNAFLSNPVVKALLPQDLRLMWASKPTENNAITLFAIKANTRDGKAPLDGSTIIDARQDFDMRGNVEVTMQMNAEGAAVWAEMTKKNIGKSIAIVLDESVQSAPVVNGEIPNGRSSISMGSGSKTEQLAEGTDLANILKAGALPAPASIVDESIVGPSLGAENINYALISFIIAFIVTLVYILVYYREGGVVAAIALTLNIFFLIGAMASLQATFNLPGIAGIVLGMGMTVDANVLIFERIKEELRLGKAMKDAIAEGYRGAASAIIDGNLTTLITGFILLIFGSGPIKGFATTLIIGVFTSLFTAIFVTRMILSSERFKNKQFKFSYSWSENPFGKVAFDWVGKRKIFYIISGTVMLFGVYSMVTRGFSFGTDFTGGRTYTVEFNKDVDPETVRTSLAESFGAAPEVKTIGGTGSKLKIATNYLVAESGADVDAKVEAKLSEGLTGISNNFKIEESRKVDKTVSDDIVWSAGWSVGLSLLAIFLYIVFRFRKWQFGLGALFSLFHDIFLVMSVFSIFHGRLPFSMDIDAGFIAALLTVLGYSINDTVVVFDRVREYLRTKAEKPDTDIINDALNSTLGRTVNTSMTTFIVLILIFFMGGDSLRSFVFALIVGIALGTYSSLCVATPTVVDFAKGVFRDKKN